MNILKSVKPTAVMVAAIVSLPLMQGCALLVAGGVVAGAAYGTVKYVNNTLQSTEAVTLDQAWTAANGTLKALQMPPTTSSKDGASGKLKAQNAKAQPVLIELTRQSDHLTKIEITVGTFDSAENRSAAQQIYDQLKSRF